MAESNTKIAGDNAALTSAAGGEVIPPERARPTHGPLPAGENINVRIVDVFNENPEHPPEASENWEVRVIYPNGLIKGHQQPKGSDTAHLVVKIRNQLRGMHGTRAGDLLTALPAKVEDLKPLTVLVFEGDK